MIAVCFSVHAKWQVADGLLDGSMQMRVAKHGGLIDYKVVDVVTDYDFTGRKSLN